MNYERFTRLTQAYAVFGHDLLDTFPWKLCAKNLQLARWGKEGKVLRLKRGLYTLPEEKRKTSFSQLWLANRLYSPSYLSLEFALSWYDLIPERVALFTSVSCLKTVVFQNALGNFSYQQVKKELFFGWQELTDEYQQKILLAYPEKALLDLLYLSSDWEPSADFFAESLRLQQMDQFNKIRLQNFAKKFNMKKLNAAVQIILQMR